MANGWPLLTGIELWRSVPSRPPSAGQAARGPIASRSIRLPAPAPQTGHAEVPVLAPPASPALGHGGKQDGVTFPAENGSRASTEPWFSNLSYC